MQGFEYGHAAVFHLTGHLRTVNSELCQCIACLLGHQANILDAHKDSVHVLVGEQASFGIMDDGNKLTCGDAGIDKSRGKLLEHVQHLLSVSRNHALHTVLQQLQCLCSCHSKLLNECVRSIDSLAEVHIVCPCQCPHTHSKVLSIATFQPRCHGSHIRLAVQLVVIICPHLRSSSHSRSTSCHRSSSGKGSGVQDTHQFRVDA